MTGKKEKYILRTEINRALEEYLSRGGKINKITVNNGVRDPEDGKLHSEPEEYTEPGNYYSDALFSIVKNQQMEH